MEAQNQTPWLTLLHRCRTDRSNQWCCSIKKLSLKILQYPQKAPVLESSFKTVASSMACYFITKRPWHRCFPVNIAKSLRLIILKNICEWLLFNCFNGSLLHEPKDSGSRLYDSIRIQGWVTDLDFSFDVCTFCLELIHKLYFKTLDKYLW